MRRADLVADCARCAGVCCVATSFEASEDFAIDKPAGVACRHLSRDARCSIYGERERRGFSGCTLFDCYGAGPHATRLQSRASLSNRERDAAFRVLRELFELLWLLSEAEKLCPAAQPDLRAQLSAQITALDASAGGSLATLCELDLEALQCSCRALLRRVGAAIGGRSAARVLPVVK